MEEEMIGCENEPNMVVEEEDQLGMASKKKKNH